MNNMQLNIPNLDYQKLAKIFTGLLLFGTIYGFILFPSILKTIIKYQVRLKPGGKTREELYMEIPIDIDFTINLWNITNPEEVQAGESPIMKEVGPYKFM